VSFYCTFVGIYAWFFAENVLVYAECGTDPAFFGDWCSLLVLQLVSIVRRGEAIFSNASSIRAVARCQFSSFDPPLRGGGFLGPVNTTRTVAPGAGFSHF
jgi:hypothetical protein